MARAQPRLMGAVAGEMCNAQDFGRSAGRAGRLRVRRLGGVRQVIGALNREDFLMALCQDDKSKLFNIEAK